MSECVHRVVELPCTPDEAWDAITDPSWLGEDGEIVTVEGAEGWVRDGDETRYLYVEEIIEHERFVYRWASFVDEPSRVEIELAPSAAGTSVEIVESPLNARMLASLRS